MEDVGGEGGRVAVGDGEYLQPTDVPSIQPTMACTATRGRVYRYAILGLGMV